MYISEFWCGVGAVLFAEIALIMFLIIRNELKKKPKAK